MEEDGTDRFERADTDSRHTLYPQRWRQTERERRFSFNKQKTLDATLFSTLNADQMMISCTSTITKKEKKKKENTQEHHLQTKSPPLSCLVL